jgi:UDP-N-acetylmuramoyl-L-alanyl-D-glutamate--2,6-diaminopimelate ligase
MYELTKQLPIDISHCGEVEVSGITHDSRRVRPGDLYVALAGEHFDGRAFAAQAVERGAVAVLAAGPAMAGIEVPWLSTPQPRALLGELAARLFGHPDRELIHVGVTGTNGKSTTVSILTAILEAAGHPAGRIGTLGYVFRDLDLAAERTTPEATEYFRLLRAMRDRGAEAVVAEVSSHALAQGRVGGATYDLAVFTNLTRDHLDFHGDLETYFLAKRELFELVEPTRAVFNLDDPWGRRLALEIPQGLGYGSEADVRPGKVTLDMEGIRGSLRTPRGTIDFETRLIGRYNLENILAAVAGAEALELPHQATSAALASLPTVPGRLERVSDIAGFPVLVDFAHTDGALRAALESVRELSDRKVIVVFGCGGDRDQTKRAPMGEIAGELADLAILTSDNPRSEDPLEILAAVERGLRSSGADNYLVEPDRRRAIRTAIAQADKGSIVVVAGKGHERVQIVGSREISFSDHEEIRAALEERVGTEKAG